jgi:V-type H+-transporting ATPase subunit a
MDDKLSPLKPLVEIRYLLTIMGFFAFYSGFIYNEFFAIPWNLFGSCYENHEHFRERISDDCVYPFGIDPKWFGTSNELSFFNSFKMKMAVIIGVA